MNLLISSILISLFVIIYYLMIKTFTVLFRITGLTREKAHFQVISLLTNSGFTTSESELIATNRSRRRIAKFVMITGMVFNVFIASLLINILININNNDKLESLKIVGIASACLVTFLIIIKIPIVSRGIDKLVEKIANKIRRKNHNENVIIELDSYGSRSIVEVYITKLPEELKEKSIIESEIKSKYNINVLLVSRNGRIIDAKPDLLLQNEDKLVLFGKLVNVKALFEVKDDELIEENKTNELNKLEVIDNFGTNALVQIEIKHLPSILVEKTLGESVLKDNYDINVLMIKRNKKEKLVTADSRIEVGDKIVLIGPYEYIKTLFIEQK